MLAIYGDPRQMGACQCHGAGVKSTGESNPCAECGLVGFEGVQERVGCHLGVVLEYWGNNTRYSFKHKGLISMPIILDAIPNGDLNSADLSLSDRRCYSLILRENTQVVIFSI